MKRSSLTWSPFCSELCRVNIIRQMPWQRGKTEMIVIRSKREEGLKERPRKSWLGKEAWINRWWSNIVPNFCNMVWTKPKDNWVWSSWGEQRPGPACQKAKRFPENFPQTLQPHHWSAKILLATFWLFCPTLVDLDPWWQWLMVVGAIYYDHLNGNAYVYKNALV